MSRSIKRVWILAAAVGAVSIAASSVSLAQYRVDTGHVNDANNRIGAGGLNGDSRFGHGQYTGVTGNDIVTGNVTQGKQFRGFVPYSEERAFRGFLPERTSDLFIRSSSGTPYGGYGGYNSNANTLRPFYGDSRAAAPPPGFTPTNIGSGGYVPAPIEQRIGSDLRLGNPLDITPVALPAPGTTVLPGPVDPSTNNNTLITASSLYGVRQWNARTQADQQSVSRYANVFGENMAAAPLSDLEVDAMRRELQQSAGAQGKVVTSDLLAAARNQIQNPNLAATPPASDNLLKDSGNVPTTAYTTLLKQYADEIGAALKYEEIPTNGFPPFKSTITFDNERFEGFSKNKKEARAQASKAAYTKLRTAE